MGDVFKLFLFVTAAAAIVAAIETTTRAIERPRSALDRLALGLAALLFLVMALVAVFSLVRPIIEPAG